MSAYLADTDIVDVDDWEGERTSPGRVTTAQLVAESEALAVVRQWLEVEQAQERKE
jgi:hypothetical protein